MADKQIDVLLEDDPNTYLTHATALTPLGGYILGVVTAGGNGVVSHLTDAQCDHLEVAAYAHKATIHRA